MIDVQVDTREVAELLKQLDRRLSQASQRIFLRSVVWPHLQNRMRSRFASEGDAASGKWQQLAEATGRIRAAGGFSPFHPINVRTGAMKSFATSSYNINNVGKGGTSLNMPGSGMSAMMKRKVQLAQQGGFGRGKKSGRPGPNRPAPPRPIYVLDVVDQVAITTQLLNMIRGGV